MRDGPSLLAQPRAPKALTREGRCELIRECIAALLAGKLPSREASLFLGSALDSWVTHGGALEKHLRVSPGRGRRTTARVLLSRMPELDGKTGDEIA
jgi:hypothetical protein